MEGKKIQGARTLALLACLCMMIGLLGVGAGAVDVTQPCVLTVEATNSTDTEFLADIARANVLVDAYRVAAAAEVEGYDTYTYTPLAPYNLEIPAEPDSDEWAALAQTAAAIALDAANPATPAAKDVKVDTPIPDLIPGLYLLVAHGEGLEDYVRRTPAEGETPARVDTLAQSPDYEYSFAPVLVSLPTKNDVNEDGTITTAAEDGDWVYDPTVSLKPTRDRRFGSLTITKTLNPAAAYDAIEPVTFTFRLDVTQDGAPVALRGGNLAEIAFSAAGTGSVTVEDIPVGAVVTVTEETTGIAGIYRQISADPAPVTITAEEVLEVTFVNEKVPTPKHGHSIVNTFEYDEESGWTWVPVIDGVPQFGE